MNDDRGWEAQWLGLTEREAVLLIACSNGCVLSRSGSDVVQMSGCADYLAAHVLGALKVRMRIKPHSGSVWISLSVILPIRHLNMAI